MNCGYKYDIEIGREKMEVKESQKWDTFIKKLYSWTYLKFDSARLCEKPKFIIKISMGCTEHSVYSDRSYKTITKDLVYAYIGCQVSILDTKHATLSILQITVTSQDFCESGNILCIVHITLMIRIILDWNYRRWNPHRQYGRDSNDSTWKTDYILHTIKLI